MNSQCLGYALSKQLPLGGNKITLETDFGTLTLEGSVGRKSVIAIRRIIIMEVKRMEKKQGGQS